MHFVLGKFYRVEEEYFLAKVFYLYINGVRVRVATRSTFIFMHEKLTLNILHHKANAYVPIGLMVL